MEAFIMQDSAGPLRQALINKVSIAENALAKSRREIAEANIKACRKNWFYQAHESAKCGVMRASKLPSLFKLLRGR